MHKKIIMISAVVLLMTAFFIGCGKNEPVQATDNSQQSEQTSKAQTAEKTAEPESNKPQATPPPPSDEVQVGLLFSGKGYETEMVKNGVRTLMAMSSLKLPVTEIEANAEDPMEAMNTLIGEGCEIIFTCGVEGKFVAQAALSYPDVNFEVYEGYDIGTFHNVSAFYSRTYQQQYLNGMIAGYISANGNIGYLSQSAETTDIRRVNAFALGAKSANPEAVVHFAWTGENEDGAVAETSEALCGKGCDVIFSAEPDAALIAMAEEKNITLICPGNTGPDTAVRMIEPSIFSYAYDKAYRTARHSYTANGIIEGWVGIEPYEINFDRYPQLGGEQRLAIQDAATRMATGQWDVFTGPITDKYGQTIIPQGVVIPDEDLLKMLWYVGNIEALQPPVG